MKLCVLVDEGLVLKDYVLDAGGCPKSGWVVNGAWRWELRDGEILAKHRDGTIVTRRPHTSTEFRVFFLENDRRGYNAQIAEAQANRDKALVVRLSP